MTMLAETATRHGLRPMHRLVLIPDDLPRQAVAVFAPAPDGRAPLVLVSERRASDAVLALSASIAWQHHSAQPRRTLLLLDSGELLDQDGTLVESVDVRLLSDERGQPLHGLFERYPGRSIDVPEFGRGRVIGLD